MNILLVRVLDNSNHCHNIAPGDSVLFETWDTFKEEHITVIAGEVEWHYKPAYISHAFGQLHRFTHWLFKLQIEKNGDVFVLAPDDDFPQEMHITQPEHYPLRPVYEEEPSIALSNCQTAR